jgi:hypothetical protein
MTSGLALLIFLVFATGGSVIVGVAIRSAWRSRRPAQRSTGTRRPPARTGGKSSRPTRRRVRKCAVYEIPSFAPDRHAYIGMSVRPDLRIPQHMIKWWWKYVDESVRITPGTRRRRAVISGVKITWYPNEAAAYKAEQALIGKFAPWFCIEGNFGRGIATPADRRLRPIRRRYEAVQRQKLAMSAASHGTRV